MVFTILFYLHFHLIYFEHLNIIVLVTWEYVFFWHENNSSVLQVRKRNDEVLVWNIIRAQAIDIFTLTAGIILAITPLSGDISCIHLHANVFSLKSVLDLFCSDVHRYTDTHRDWLQFFFANALFCGCKNFTTLYQNNVRK